MFLNQTLDVISTVLLLLLPFNNLKVLILKFVTNIKMTLYKKTLCCSIVLPVKKLLCCLAAAGQDSALVSEDTSMVESFTAVIWLTTFSITIKLEVWSWFFFTCDTTGCSSFSMYHNAKRALPITSIQFQSFPLYPARTQWFLITQGRYYYPMLLLACQWNRWNGNRLRWQHIWHFKIAGECRSANAD